MMIKWALRARKIITCTYIIIVMSLIIIFGMPIFGKSMRLASNITDSTRSLAIQTFYIYDVTKRPQYELTFISQCISLATASILYTGIDNFLGLLVFHICGQLDIIRNRFKHGHENFHVKLRRNMICHVRLLKYVCIYCNKYIPIHLIYVKCYFRAINIIEDTYNMILLILFLYFRILFALCGFLLITVSY